MHCASVLYALCICFIMPCAWFICLTLGFNMLYACLYALRMFICFTHVYMPYACFICLTHVYMHCACYICIVHVIYALCMLYMHCACYICIVHVYMHCACLYALCMFICICIYHRVALSATLAALFHSRM